jgi:RimJ/RimL family protein N-acetyltransferase
MIIEGSQFILRPYRVGDEAALVRHADNWNVWRNLAEVFPHPYTMKAAKDWIQRNLDDAVPHLSLAITVDDEVVGGIGVMAKNDVYVRMGEVGYWLSEAYWGRGIATEAVGLVVRYAFDELKLARLEAGVFDWNPASARVLEKNGFTLEATLKNRIFKDGQLTNELLYGRLP